jgi:hypothetical protein
MILGVSLELVSNLDSVETRELRREDSCKDCDNNVVIIVSENSEL